MGSGNGWVEYHDASKPPAVRRPAVHDWSSGQCGTAPAIALMRKAYHHVRACAIAVLLNATLVCHQTPAQGRGFRGQPGHDGGDIDYGVLLGIGGIAAAIYFVFSVGSTLLGIRNEEEANSIGCFGVIAAFFLFIAFAWLTHWQ